MCDDVLRLTLRRWRVSEEYEYLISDNGQIRLLSIVYLKGKMITWALGGVG